MKTNGREVIGGLIDDVIFDLAQQLQEAEVALSESQRTLAQRCNYLCSRVKQVTSPSQNSDVENR